VNISVNIHYSIGNQVILPLRAAGRNVCAIAGVGGNRLAGR